MNGDRVFHIGDKVVYPNHGVGIIEQISSRTIGTTMEQFYLSEDRRQQPEGDDSFQQRRATWGCVPVVRNGEVQKIVDYLSTGECINAADWKDRFKENSDRMRTGSLSDVAMVLKSLLILAQEKSLSFREKKMLERARYLLVSEIAISRNCDWRPRLKQALTKALTSAICGFRKLPNWPPDGLSPRVHGETQIRRCFDPRPSLPRFPLSILPPSRTETGRPRLYRRI